MDGGLLLVRLVVGLTLAAHGAQKLFGWFGGPGVKGWTEQVRSMQFRAPRTLAWGHGAAEFLAGLAFAVGFLTPVAAAAIVAVMTLAAVLVHRPNGFFITEGGFEYCFVLAGTAVGVALTGPGAWAVDAAAGWSLAGATWGLAALVVGLLVAGIVGIGFRRGAAAGSAQPAH